MGVVGRGREEVLELVVAGQVGRQGGVAEQGAAGRVLGRISVSMQLVSYGTIPLGALLGGALGTAIGVRPALWVLLGALALTGPVLLLGPLRQHRDLPDRPARGWPAPEC